MLNPQAREDRSATIFGTLLRNRTGQELGTSRAWRIESALQPVLRHTKVEDLAALADAVEVQPDGPLADIVIDALLNQETRFYRDPGVIELAVEALAARRATAGSRRLRVWSAGCSAGQEPYSLAMLLSEQAANGDPGVEIVATDVSGVAIARARAGRYSQFEIQRGLPVRRMMTWFEADGEEWTARGELVRQISFRRHNLVTDPPPYGAFDLVLCRNVLFYFPLDTRQLVFDRLASALRPGGLLILGAGETTIGQTDRFIPSGAFRGAYDLAPSAN